MAVLGTEEAFAAGDVRCLPASPLGARALSPPMHVRNGVRWSLLAGAISLFALAASLVIGSAPALALSQRGHVPAFFFGMAGGGPGQFATPAGIAVRASDGHVFVADSRTNRVQEFAPVVNPQGELAGEQFVRALAVPNPEWIAVDNSRSAGDPSRGDVYVSGTTKKGVKEEEFEDKIVYKFNAGGGLIAKLKKFKREKGEPAEEFEPIEGLAVDLGGNLSVYDEEGTIARFNNAPKNQSRVSRRAASFLALESPFAVATPGMALDSKGRLYLGHVSENPGAIGVEGKPTVVGNCEISEGECEAVISELDQFPTTGVAVNTADEPANKVSELDDAYITNVQKIAGNAVTTVAAFSPAGALIQRFGVGGLTQGNGIAVDSRTGAVFVTDAAARNVAVFKLEAPGLPRVDSLSSCLASACGPGEKAVRLDAQVDPSGADTHAFFEYGLSSCGTSGCENKTSESDLGEGFGDQGLSAKLPSLGPGTYHYRVVASNGFGTVTSDERTFSIALPAAGSPPTLPDGRAWEMVSPPNKDGFEPEAIVAEGGTIQAAQNGGAITYVADGPIPAEGSPEGNRVPELTQVISDRRSNAWSSQDISTANTTAPGVREGSPQAYQAFSPNLSLAMLQPFIGSEHTGPFAEPPLSPQQKFEVGGGPVTELEQEKTIYLRPNPPLAPGAGEQENYQAAQANGTTMKNAGYLAVVTEANALGVLGGPKQGEAKFGGGVQAGLALMLATPDLSHGLFKSFRPAPGRHGGDLYEWGPNPVEKLRPNPKLQLVSLLPKNFQGQELPAERGILVFGAQPNMRHAISDNGSRVFWTRRNGEAVNLFVRDTETQETIQVDKGTSGIPPGHPDATFQTASADGSKVFFTDTQRLTPDSHALQSPLKADLYVLELHQTIPLSGTLTDLTAQGAHGESGDVQQLAGGGGVIGASEDGTYVYFVANGALGPNDPQGNCDIKLEVQDPGRTCNLYLRHFDGSEWGAPKLIAVLSNEDAPSWGSSAFPGDMKALTSRVSPNGRYLAFMSNRSLTGYNNVDANPAANGARDEEVFLYDASLDRLVCASCNPSGAQPEGIYDPGAGQVAPTPGAEGLGLLIDRPDVWGPLHGKVDHWLAANVPGWTPLSLERSIYQSHYLSDSGRLFFNSTDHLVEAATGAKAKVFEYEPGGVGGCGSEGGCIGLVSAGSNAGESEREHESAFLDASENGNDVFFLTAAKLPATNGTSGDVDSNFDVYDARVCAQGPGASCLPGPPLGQLACDEVNRSCRGAQAKPGSFVAPVSSYVTGPGNIATREVRGIKEEEKPKSHVSRAQLLKKALTACRAKYKKDKKKRVSCEAKARKRYGQASSHKKSKKSSRSHGRRA